MDATTTTPREFDLYTARVLLSDFSRAYDFKGQRTMLRTFMASLPPAPEPQSRTDEIDERCIICHENFWSQSSFEKSEDPLQLPCCEKLIGRVCLELWLSSSIDGKSIAEYPSHYLSDADSKICSGGGNAHTCPFCRQGLINPWPEFDEPEEAVDDEPTEDYVPLEPVFRWVSRW